MREGRKEGQKEGRKEGGKAGRQAVSQTRPHTVGCQHSSFGVSQIGRAHV